MLSEEQKEAVDALIDSLFELPESARWDRWRGITETDPAVRKEVESLLTAAESMGDFLAKAARPQPSEADDVDDEFKVGAILDGWRITGRVGRGGMGEVYEAERVQGDFEQRVAIKVLQREARAELDRFHVERQILARLEHPAIARLLDGGATPDSRPYMVMEYVQGLPITQYCASTQATLEQRLRLFVQICEAVAYAHSALVVHRDLKPSNILVTGSGQVKLLDFGVAKLLDAQAGANPMTQAPLTPSCAAPEQLLGQTITTATDTYALGILLFDLLTGRHPWVSSGEPIAQAIRAVLSRPAPLASTVAAANEETPVPARALRGDLDAILAKSLREEPGRRYVTADSLKSDINHFLTGQPVAARAGARLYVLSRLLKRHWAAAAGLSIVLISLVGGMGVAAWQARRAEVERDNARRDAAREEAVRYGLTRMFRAAISDEGGQKASAKDMIDQSAQRVLAEYREQPKLAGPLVISLADLYGALEDVEGAGNLLDGFLQEQSAGADPAIRADAQQKLAHIELLRGHTDRCAQLLDQSEAFWAKAPRYAEERLEGLGVRAQLQRAQGKIDDAIRTSRTAIEQRTALSGRNNRETAILYNSLAITLTSANHLEEALQAYQDTLAIYTAIGMGDGLDAQVVRGNVGTLDLRTGRIRDAQEQLKNAFERERALAGNSAAVAAAMGYYGRSLWVLAHPDQAVKVLRESVTLASQYAGAASPVAVQNTLFLGDAQVSAGDLEGAKTTLTTASDAAHTRYGDSHPLTLRARLASIRWKLASSASADVTKELGEVIAVLRTAGAAASAGLAEGLEMLGAVQFKSHQLSTAIVSLSEAARIREAAGSQSWELARVRLLLGEALQENGDPQAARDLIEKARDVLLKQLGPEHPDTQRAQKALSH